LFGGVDRPFNQRDPNHLAMSCHGLNLAPNRAQSEVLSNSTCILGEIHTKFLQENRHPEPIDGHGAEIKHLSPRIHLKGF
jgi:hypothetical protein